MELQPHQLRVVEEKSDLDSKLESLGVFINESSLFANLSYAEQYRLNEQYSVMMRYSEILAARISEF
jgi:hypothetical protein